MPHAPEFLKTLALVLCVAAVATVVFQRMRQPVVFGYLLAGLIVGPHTPIPLIADVDTVRMLAELGVILLMFSLGLEFSIRKLLQVVPTAGLIAVAETSALGWLGFGVAQLLGWSLLESLYAGAIVAISSTTIIIKAFAEHNVPRKTREIVFGILIIEDLIAIFLLVALTALSSSGEISAATLGVTALRLAVFLAGLVGVGLLVVPRLMRMIASQGRRETTLVASVGICFASALLALSFGYSVALGAFVAGSLIAESGTERVVEHLVQPVRDMFAAIFFVSVGMLIDPGLVVEHAGAVLAIAAIIIVGKAIAVSVSAFLTGIDARTSVQAGMSLGQIGEFSFIIAALGLSTGSTREFLYPVAIAAATLTTFTTPYFIRAAVPVAAFVDNRLPKPLQTFAALYGSWIERLRGAPDKAVAHSRSRRAIWLLLVDAAVLGALIVGTAIETDRLSGFLTNWLGVSDATANAFVLAAAVLLAAPLIGGIVHTARVIGRELAFRALPAGETGKVDFAAAPRRALVTSLQLAIVLLIGIPLLAITQPFLPPLRGLAVLAILIALLAIAFWRSATNLQGHARAGAEIIASVIASQMARRDSAAADAANAPLSLEDVLPGLGTPVLFRIEDHSPGAGKSLAALRVRGLTGATVLAISRDGKSIVVPTGSDVVCAGDVVALAGSHDAVEAAKALLSPADPVAADRV